ncbi:unnamed protein product [Periconia digitata]|uniref:Uncharacterized protein n=1 Tax=Periconia digitata TaxID=1303443 RepID=A0A9W4UUX7_9PLEO|nr:unnamed protein product [Periconia digitata]
MKIMSTMTNITLRQQRLEGLQKDFESSKSAARELFFHWVRFLYSVCEPECQKLRECNILPDDTKIFRERVLSKDHSRHQNQDLALLSHLFVLSRVSRQAILEPDPSFTPNENVEVLMEILQIEHWTQLGTGAKTLKGRNWADLIYCLGMKKPKVSFVPPVLQRLLSDISCHQILELYSEVSACNVPIKIDDVSQEDSVKFLIPVYRYPAIACSEYATCDKSLRWFCKLLQQFQSFNLETRFTLLMAAASMLRNLIEVRVPSKEHFTWRFRLTTWIDPLVSLFEVGLDCCEHHIWIQLEECIREELEMFCDSHSKSHTKLVGIVRQFLLWEPLRGEELQDAEFIISSEDFKTSSLSEVQQPAFSKRRLC